ncbi:hypothetical protein [Clostridium intestinale]|nr:hypothetical protein [Clostridium intestinale]
MKILTITIFSVALNFIVYHVKEAYEVKKVFEAKNNKKIKFRDIK